ncbi:acid phosphatase [Histoplasma capsulatum var. duboisii H88]|uniref:Acid phosphatase n=1 Tax=Ajellomyces capsulatus (strain H88) TaxID=544711 RepID=F0UF89_AJEC8|nr:acid phosphatase [Histoplasma capsulatum var. duboisii H88]QSS54887.1 acid phosphatase [Histoplasma capsulatum var. duboisii H88]
MTSLVPREPYSKEELHKLYPDGLQLQLVQVFLRHGERTPVSSRFQNTGLATYWPYCNAARRLTQIASSTEDLTSWDSFQWRRRMESFGENDQAAMVVGPKGEIEGICLPGELTDKGRQSTFALGRRLRYLYVDQLGFMPKIRSNTDDMYLRTTPIPRALESLQQTFWGMYPPDARTANFRPPTIVARSFADETLYPNESNCHRFRQLARLFAQRAADKWNQTADMEYLNSLWSKWMPSSSPRVAVDSRPRLSGILDTINSTLAHGPNTRLPAEFYDAKALEIIDKIAMDEWFTGYRESNEYRKLGIGALMGDIVDRMVHASVHGGWKPTTNGAGDANGVVKFAISGCHDTTIAAILTSLGAFDDGKWPPYTSSIAVELFKATGRPHAQKPGDILEELNVPEAETSSAKRKPSSLMSKLFYGKSSSSPSFPEPSKIARSTTSGIPTPPLQDYYVRLRYNDQPVRIPGCASKPSNHLPGNDTFCTLEAFKKIADKFTPRNWHEECAKNLDSGMFAEGNDAAGY